MNNTHKREWEKASDARIRFSLKEARRLIERALKKPDPALTHMVSDMMHETTHMLLARGSSKYIGEKKYDLEVDEDGRPFVSLADRAAGNKVSPTKVEGYA